MQDTCVLQIIPESHWSTHCRRQQFHLHWGQPVGRGQQPQWAHSPAGREQGREPRGQRRCVGACAPHRACIPCCASRLPGVSRIFKSCVQSRAQGARERQTSRAACSPEQLPRVHVIRSKQGAVWLGGGGLACLLGKGHHARHRRMPAQRELQIKCLYGR